MHGTKIIAIIDRFKCEIAHNKKNENSWKWFNNAIFFIGTKRSILVLKSSIINVLF